MSKKFINALKNADSEKLIEAAYQRYIKEELERIGCKVNEFQTTHKTDGILDGSFEFDGRTITFKLLLEVKFDEDFTKRTVKTKVLIQTLYYIKTIELEGEKLPDVILIGDKNECFTLDTRFLLKYLDKNLDWSLAPSTAANDKSNIKLFTEIENDQELHSKLHIHYINDNFDLVHVADEIKAITSKEPIKRRITEYNISRIFEYFVMKVLKRKSDGTSEYNPREQVEYFMQLVLNNESCYQHPKKKNKALINTKEVNVESDAFTSFMNYYIFDDYNAKEKKSLTEIADRLIEDSDRRMRGDFYTPSIWVDEAHKMLTEELGHNWREEYMVWDCAWGTGNLTRDYHFNDLYASTLFQHDIDAGAKYNQNATKFQYDFLNDDVELFEELQLKVEEGYELTMSDFGRSKLFHKAPMLIQGLLAGKKLLFLINPPYGTANNFGESSKEGMAKNKINELMIKNKIGGASQQLYAQFMYRLSLISGLFNLKEYKLGLYSKATFISGDSYKDFRKYFYKKTEFKNGFIFQASQFADVSASWGVVFTIWESGQNYDEKLKLKVFDMDNNKIVHIKDKYIYNSLNRKASDWVKKPIKKLSLTKDVLSVNGSIKIKDSKTKGALLLNNSLGYMHNNANSVMYNNQFIGLYSTSFAAGHGVAIGEENFENIISLFMARKLITSQYSNWINDKDEYLEPEIMNKNYSKWVKNSLIASLFSTASNQSALRQIDYKDKKWDIKNEFFFMSKKQMEELTLEYNNDEVYHDIELHGQKERYVYEQIQEVLNKMEKAKETKLILTAIELNEADREYTNEEIDLLIEQSKYEGFSPKALEVYKKACELVKESFVFRNRFNDEKPEYHINTWDAGWYQIKGLLKEYMPEELKEFNKLYKELEDEMRPLVYELGFLYE